MARLDVIKAWVKELRTTEHCQIVGQLGYYSGGRCCLGVLADVVFKQFPDLVGENYERIVRSSYEEGIDPTEEYMIVERAEGQHNDSCAILPYNLWVEIAGTPKEAKLDQGTAYRWNDDDGMNFYDIADQIERLYLKEGK